MQNHQQMDESVRMLRKTDSIKEIGFLDAGEMTPYFILI